MVTDLINTGSAIFKENCLALSRAGYSPLPIWPGEKRPAIFDWQQFCDAGPTFNQLHEWVLFRPKACGIGTACGIPVGEYQLIVIDLDVEDEGDLDRVVRALPRTPMAKRGRKGLSLFYRAPPTMKSATYKTAGGEQLADLLAKGRQTVLPPSIHPATKRPYEWVGRLVPAYELPIISEDDLERFEETLELLGWDGDRCKTRSCDVVDDNVGPGEDDDPYFGKIKSFALANPSLWVPTLGLTGLVTKRDGGYRAVATWTQSGHGRPNEQREPTLSIHPHGIVDFGDKYTGYDAIGLVAKVKGQTRADAAFWLWSTLGLESENDAYFSAFDMADARSECEEGPPPLAPAIDESTTPLAHAPDPHGLVFDDRERNAALIPSWLVKGLVLENEPHLLYGQSGAGKGFLTLDLAASLLSGRPFMGQRVKQTGGTIFALGESPGQMPHRLNAMRLETFGGEAPTNPETGQSMDLDRLPIVWFPVENLSSPPIFRQFEARVAHAMSEMKRLRGCPARLLIIDTVVASYGFEEEPDQARVSAALKQLTAMGKRLGIAVMGVHHVGKSREAGATGSFMWTGGVEVALNADCEKHPITGVVSDRKLIVFKDKHGGNNGRIYPYELKVVELGRDEDGDPITSCVSTWSGGVEQAHASRSQMEAALAAQATGLGRQAQRFLGAFDVVFAGAAMNVALETGEVIQVVRVRDIKAEHFHNHARGTEDSKRRAFDRDLKSAKEAGLVDLVPGEDGGFIRRLE